MAFAQNYPIVGTNQSTFYDNQHEIKAPSEGEPFYGQNANYPGNVPSYTDNGDGTVTDKVTGLMWQQSFDHNGDGKINVDDKLTYNAILEKFGDGGVTFGSYDDWRLPTIKEMYSLIVFSGRDTSPENKSTEGHTPFIDNAIFEFAYGDLNAGERLIDMQCATTTVYVSKEVSSMVFGVNFADGRIKGYGLGMPGRGDKTFNYLLVRGNTSYGSNDFVDNTDGTITDEATGLMWMQDDNGKGLDWEHTLIYAEGKEFAGYSDWRLPDAKELQSIVDYERSPATTNSAAIDPLFNCTQITNEAGEVDYPWYWSSTTHAREGKISGSAAIYVAFGKSMGNMPSRPSEGMPGMKRGASKRPSGPPPRRLEESSTNETPSWIDVHGAGSQRSDPKSGNPSDFADGHGPQGDAVRVFNYVRLVRNVN
ncbi:DUF1566 domain-containing protein [Maribacter sp. ANRC-HE7]|uniref:DUF1566 domain-containing protein n=2 Tax=Maribacter aquimaris TaxID=2737171 RepID=A0ABR7V2H1_9FLAO|nr:DUF1566 domain-containing protein [Maribacter aquimaris]